MLNELKKQMNRSAKTENGAVTLMSTQSHCLDLFATIGALRNASEDDIITRFMLAYAENPDLAMKILFYARDIRGGIGERDTFRFALRALANTNPSSVSKNISYIAEFGRYDDLLVLLGTPCEAEALALLKRQFDADMISLQNGMGVVSLLGKWLPSVNASNAKAVANAKKIAKAFGLRDVEYRKALTALRARIRIIENNLRERDYTFDYEQQPSRALLKYRAAFERNDNRRYREYQLRVQNGKARMHTAGLAPYDIVKPVLRRKAIEEGERHALDLAWENLPDYNFVFRGLHFESKCVIIIVANLCIGRFDTVLEDLIMIYGYARVSTQHQRIARQVTNILEVEPKATIIREHYTGTTLERPAWTQLVRKLVEGDTVVFDSVSRFARNAKEGFEEYKKLFEAGIMMFSINCFLNVLSSLALNGLPSKAARNSSNLSSSIMFPCAWFIL